MPIGYFRDSTDIKAISRHVERLKERLFWAISEMEPDWYGREVFYGRDTTVPVKLSQGRLGNMEALPQMVRDWYSSLVYKPNLTADEIIELCKEIVFLQQKVDSLKSAQTPLKKLLGFVPKFIGKDQKLLKEHG